MKAQNTGNTGQRYKLQKYVSVEIEDEIYVKTTLACGHSVRANCEQAGSAQWLLKYRQQEIKAGKRTRCSQCPA